jgi:hypothetical protein
MAITPMQLPSPKAYDPNQMEVTNLQLFKDPYTVDRASLQADVFRSDREAAGEQYQHSVAAQQDYYNRALEYQNQGALRDDFAKFGNQNMPHGLALMQGIPEFAKFLERMGPVYGTVANQAFQNAVAGTAKTAGEAAKLGYESGHEMSPATLQSVTGLPSVAQVPGKLREISLENQGRLAAAGAHADKDGMVTIYPNSIGGYQVGPVKVPASVAEGGEPAIAEYLKRTRGIPIPPSATKPPGTGVVHGGTTPPAATPKAAPAAPTPNKVPGLKPAPANPYSAAPAKPPPAAVAPPPPQRSAPVASAADWGNSIKDIVARARKELGL